MENQQNNLIQTSRLNVFGEPSCTINISGFSLDNYRTFNPEGYTILCQLGELSDGLKYFPNTSKIVLDSNQRSLLFANFQQFIPNLAQDMQVSQATALSKSVDFFADNKLVVQPVGIQGKVYRTLQSVQNYLPMASTSQAVTLLKTSGITGLNIITQAPLTFVGATYIGAMFFSYCGSVAGNNPVGVLLNSTSFLLSRPMRGVEVVLNGLFLTPISNTIGLPMVLNGTQEMLTGKGLSLQEYTKIGLAFERITNSKSVQKIKKIYKVIRNKD